MVPEEVREKSVFREDWQGSVHIKPGAARAMSEFLSSFAIEMETLGRSLGLET